MEDGTNQPMMMEDLAKTPGVRRSRRGVGAARPPESFVSTAISADFIDCCLRIWQA